MIELALALVSISIILNALLLSANIPFVSLTKKRKIVADIAYSLVWEAERVWGADKGAVKRAHVKAKLYITLSSLPILKGFILQEVYIDKVIDEALAKMTDYNLKLDR